MTNFNLNSQQLAAVMDTEGAILVSAGAGSGKTRVLTARICHLIESGVSPYNILAITFTNKAASEMKERIANLIGGQGVWTSTFHSMCARILREYADRIGYTRDFTIYTDIESERVVKRVLQNISGTDVKDKGEYLWHISRAKTYAMSPQKYYESIEDYVGNARAIRDVFKAYDEELFRCNCMDFDDLLLKVLQLFESCPDVLQHYQQRFQYIHVDEFQDTNILQYKICKLLCSLHGNLFVVGDEDQSIYSWRGAEIRNILDFQKDFKNAKVYKLEQNYRSTTTILKAANSVIKNNENRNDKTLWSEIKDNSSIEYYEAYNDREEASRVARGVNNLVSMGENYKDIAILVRANSLTRPFEEEFNLHGIPYKVFGGFRFYERKEIKDALAYMRLAVNPNDNDSVLRIINYPKRGIGETAVKELQRIAVQNGVSYFTVLTSASLLPPSLAKKFESFTQIARDLVANVKKMSLLEFAQFAIRRSGLELFLSSSGIAEDQSRLENIEELINAINQFAQDNKDATIDDFMQSVALVSDTDEMDNQNYVTIATIHAVKGLEYDNVFIVGLEEGIFPTQKGDMEEERRLMYVAITRARKRLFVLNARQRYRFGKTEYYPKSRFIGEMTGYKQSMRFTNSNYGEQQPQSTERKKLGANKPVGNYKRSEYAVGSIDNIKKSTSKIDYSKFKKNTIVEHNKFGRGIIIDTSGEGENKIASIAFKGLGVKRFSLAIAGPNLKIVED